MNGKRREANYQQTGGKMKNMSPDANFYLACKAITDIDEEIYRRDN